MRIATNPRVLRSTPIISLLQGCTWRDDELEYLRNHTESCRTVADRADRIAQTTIGRSRQGTIIIEGEITQRIRRSVSVETAQADSPGTESRIPGSSPWRGPGTNKAAGGGPARGCALILILLQHGAGTVAARMVGVAHVDGGELRTGGPEQHSVHVFLVGAVKFCLGSAGGAKDAYAPIAGVISTLYPI